MDKLLTVSVAAYNMEKYLQKTLESLTVPEVLDAIEVFVVDDGGKDNSLAIAHEFAFRYPDSFHAVHKENGGYGTTINWSLTHATGKYFRPLDGDDWFDCDGLIKLVDALRQTDVDAIYTPSIRVNFIDDDKEVSRSLRGAISFHGTLTDFPNPKILNMHRLTWRTDLLRAMRLDLPGRLLYTDNIYATYPLAEARSLLTLDTPLYCHRLGRAEQSISVQNRIRHLDDSLTVAEQLAGFCQVHTDSPNSRLILGNAEALNRHNLRLLLSTAADQAGTDRLRRYDRAILDLCPELYARAAKVDKIGRALGLLRKVNYLPCPALAPLFHKVLLKGVSA